MPAACSGAFSPYTGTNIPAQSPALLTSVPAVPGSTQYVPVSPAGAQPYCKNHTTGLLQPGHMFLVSLDLQHPLTSTKASSGVLKAPQSGSLSLLPFPNSSLAFSHPHPSFLHPKCFHLHPHLPPSPPPFCTLLPLPHAESLSCSTPLR